MRTSILRLNAVGLGAVGAFFVFYSVRLLVVTGMLRHTRAGGGGAFVGAVAFPVLAVCFGWAGFRMWRRAGQRATGG
jgi:hypothetical protein